MIELNIPGWGKRQLEHLLLDLNGTLALDGALLPEVDERLAHLSMRLRLHLITADTFGTANKVLGPIEHTLHLLGPGPQDQQKMELARSLGPSHCAAMGNGRNDRLMLQESVLGIAILGPEGACAELFTAADVISRDIKEALDLLLNPLRLTATLRK